MAAKRSLVRGGITLAVLAALAGAMVVAPAGAHVTGKFGHLKKHIKKIANKTFDQKIGPATEPFLKKPDNIAVAQQNASGSDISDPEQINSVSITAPYNGFLVISGSVEVDEDGGFLTEFCLTPLVDGSSVPPSGDGACGDVDGANFDFTNLAYTVVTPVTAGTHSVTQEIRQAGATDDYSEGHLVVQFVATGNVANIARVVPKSRS
jgi:hypothetical protein